MAQAASLRARSDAEGAVRALQEAVALAPDDIWAHIDLSAALHRAGDPARAWDEYEWRRGAHDFPEPPQSPEWDGTPLDGRTLLVIGEQGLGDQIQYLRYVPALAAGGADVVVVCDRPLVRLFQTCDGPADVVREGDQLPDHDVHVFAGSLPRLAGAPPPPYPYVHAPPKRVERWREFLGRRRELRIAINWEGNPANVAGRHRAVPLRAFLPLVCLAGSRVLSLQKGPPAEQLGYLPPTVEIVDLGRYFRDMADTAAAVSQMDLVVTNDTSVAHLVGALGMRGWVLVPADACWRWGDAGTRTPWYPSLRLFRQRSGEGWGPVVERVRDAVAAEIAVRSGRPPARPQCGPGRAAARAPLATALA